MCCLYYRGRIGGNKSSLTKIRKVLWPRPSYSLMTIANRWYGSYPWWWSWWWSSRFKDPWFVNFTDSNLRQTAGIALLSPAFLPTFLAAFQIEVTLAFHVCVYIGWPNNCVYVVKFQTQSLSTNCIYCLDQKKCGISEIRLWQLYDSFFVMPPIVNAVQEKRYNKNSSVRLYSRFT